MNTIRDTFSVSPGETVNRTFNVPTGLARIFSATVFDVAEISLFEGASEPTDILPASNPKITITLQALILNLFSELPRFSANYILNDVLGIAPFSGFSASTNYSAGVGITAVTGNKATSANYTLR